MNGLWLGLAALLGGVCGAMGLGGGFVLMLYLTALAGVPQKEAQLLNLICFLPVAAVAVWQHRKNRLLEPSSVWPVVLGGLVGVLPGVLLAGWIDATLLTRLFAGVVLICGLRSLFGKPPKH